MSHARPISANNAPAFNPFKSITLASQAYFPKLREVILGKEFPCTRPFFNRSGAVVTVAVNFHNRSVEVPIKLSTYNKPLGEAKLGAAHFRILDGINTLQETWAIRFEIDGQTSTLLARVKCNGIFTDDGRPGTIPLKYAEHIAAVLDAPKPEELTPFNRVTTRGRSMVQISRDSMTWDSGQR